MPEISYTYRRTMNERGAMVYERVPYVPWVESANDVVLVPWRSPAVKNGEEPGQGSIVVDELLRRTAAAKKALEKREAGAQAPAKEQPGQGLKPGRVIEP